LDFTGLKLGRLYCVLVCTKPTIKKKASKAGFKILS